jgi:hypothetical protein
MKARLIVEMSSVHLKPSTMEELSSGVHPLACTKYVRDPEDETVQHPVGAFIHVPDEEELRSIGPLPDDLLKVLNWANEQRIAWLNVDGDAEEIPELPAYRNEWDAWGL